MRSAVQYSREPSVSASSGRFKIGRNGRPRPERPQFEDFGQGNAYVFTVRIHGRMIGGKLNKPSRDSSSAERRQLDGRNGGGRTGGRQGGHGQTGNDQLMEPTRHVRADLPYR